MQRVIRLFPLLIGLLLLIPACGRRDEADVLPTAVPTAALPTPIPTAASQPETAVSAFDTDLIDWAPQLVYSSPAPGEDALLDGAITIRFDQPMDQSSVEAAFAVAAVDDSRTVSGSFSWPRPDTVLFTPQSQLARQQTYRVNIANTAVAANGIPLDNPILLELQTVGYLSVSQTVPADNTGGTLPTAPITVFFNRPVVPLTPGSSQGNLPQPLSFDPPVSGQGEWLSTSIYRFVPDEPLAGATTYQATVSDGLTDVTGAVLERPYTWQFTTVQPDVVAIQPENRSNLIRPSAVMTVTFNMPMNSNSAQAVSLNSFDGDVVALQTSWNETGDVLTAVPAEPLALATTYTFDVAASAARGSQTLPNAVSSRFNTVPFPAVLSTVPENGRTADRWQRGFTIRFASPMDMATLEERITISPEPEGNVTYYYNEFSNELSVDYNPSFSTRYTVTIPRSAADPYGNTLGEPYTFVFNTPERAPLASFNLPPYVAQLSTSFVTEVDVIHLNVDQVNVQLYDVGLPTGLLAQPYNLTDYNPATTPLSSWELPVENVENEAGVISLDLAGGGTLPTGVYFLSADADLSSENLYWQNQRQLLVMSDTNLVVKEMMDEVYVWATDLRSGQPAPDRNLTLYSSQGVEITTAVTDANGFARFDNPTNRDYLEGVLVISNAPGQVGFGVGSSTWALNVSPWQFGVQVAGRQPPLYAYLYTDRPIYRPGDTIYYKGIVRVPQNGRYALPPADTTLSMHLIFSQYIEGEPFDEQFTVDLLPDGTFSGEYVLPETAALGPYELFIEGNNIYSNRRLTVAEYRRPEFQVTLTPETTDALRGETVGVTLDATYFFGGSAADLPVNWTIYAAEYRLDPPGPYYAYSDDGDFDFVDTGFFGGFGGDGLGDYMGDGNGRTDSNGRLTITLPADLLDDVKAGSRRVTIEATVSDLSNFPITSRAELILHDAEVYVGVRPADAIVSSGQTATVDLKTLDWDRAPVPNQSVDVVFYRREWEATRTQDFGQYFTTWQAIDTEVARQTVQTDSNGDAQADFVPDEGGSYLAVATVTDGNGRFHRSSTLIWVADSGQLGWRIDPRDHKLNLVLDQEGYQPGDTATILVQSPYSEPVKAWLTIERGALIEQRVITLSGSSDVIELPITLDYAPNVYVTIAAVKPVNPGSGSPYADMRLGIAEIQVDPSQLGLNISLTPQDDTLAPGETAVYDIRTTDSSGTAVAADLSLALVDLAVLTLKDETVQPILDAFYSPQPYRSQIGSGLLVSGEGLAIEVPLEGGGFGGGGGDSAFDTASVALEEAEREDAVRRNFPDTAFWRANITTDASGQASIEIPLPDTLTTWRLSAKAATADTLVGEASVDIVSSIPLLLRPVTPRFFTVGDVVQIGAIVNNNTAAAIDVTVSLDASGVLPVAPPTHKTAVPANGQTLVQWEVTVQDVTAVDMTFRVEGGGYSDATKPGFGVGPDNVIPVYRYTGRDIVATAGILDEAGRTVEAVLLPDIVDTTQGTLDVQLQASLAAALLDALRTQNEWPIDETCAIDLANKLLPTAVWQQAATRLDRPDLQLDPAATETMNLLADVTTDPNSWVARLADLANSDGGWGWCRGSESQPYITSHVLFALVQADAAGYDVPTAVLTNAADYLLPEIKPPEGMTNPDVINRQMSLLYILSQVRSQNDALLLTHYAEHRDLMAPYAQALLALMLNEAGEGDAAQTLVGNLEQTAVFSATGTHWEGGNDFDNLSSDVRNTAVVLHVLAQLDPDNNLLPSAVRWLTTARRAQVWSSTYQTAWSIVALTDYMAATGDLDASYDYALGVNLQPQLDGTMDAPSGSDTLQIPLSRLIADDVNFVDIERGGGNGRLYYTIFLDSALDAAQVAAQSRGISVQRTYYDAACDPATETCEPITSIAAGQQVRVELTIIAENDLLYAVIEDPIPAGAEALDPNLDTTTSSANTSVTQPEVDYSDGYWGTWYFNRVEFRDAQVRFLADFLPAGTYQYTYFLQATLPGRYQVMPTFAYQAFFADVNGRSHGQLFVIEE